MAAYRSRATGMTNYRGPTIEELLKHVKKYGLDNRGDTFRGKPRKYKSYASLKKDTAVEVAFDYFGVETYVRFIEAIGYPQFGDSARDDWMAEHG